MPPCPAAIENERFDCPSIQSEESPHSPREKTACHHRHWTLDTEHPPPVFVSEDMGRIGRGLWKNLLSSANTAKGTDSTSSGRPTRACKPEACSVKRQAIARSHHSLYHHRPSLGPGPPPTPLGQLKTQPFRVVYHQTPTPTGHRKSSAIGGCQKTRKPTNLKPLVTLNTQAPKTS
ncbi:hypothetical protein AVEN_30265-1 [Araneus ventricosus]|uniref:Uncharacterized protein n=1 Tax=Araneus ventricosus TaxID=182803 RepID=A0A4Y2R4V0_ARAVE|nr:hypothetical protein AVEN_30265-1 [Araneus ventricosus]